MITTLYSKDARGQIRFWSIQGDRESAELEMEFGVVGGESQFSQEAVPYGKAGRTLEDQIESRVDSRINKKLDKGYVYSIEEARNNKPVNQLGLPKPMLAQRIDKVKDIKYIDSFLQYKYDGHRCLIANECGELIAYSRNGKKIDSITEILEDVKTANIEEGTILDGELYLHGSPLQTITSLIKRRQERTKDLVYICYDVISDEDYMKRLHRISNYGFGSRVQIAQSSFDTSELDIPDLLMKSISAGYEGLILRQPGYGYEDGKRSKGLIKIKKFIEDDFFVKGIVSSADGWAILQCETKEGNMFSVSAPGTMYDKEIILRNKDQYIGSIINVKYAGKTKDGIPFHPVAVRFIEKL